MKNIQQTKDQLPRRKFLKNASMASAGFMFLPRQTIGGKGFVAPSDKVNIGIVGAGGRVMGIIQGLFNQDDVQITTIADPAEYWKNMYYIKQIADALLQRKGLKNFTQKKDLILK